MVLDIRKEGSKQIVLTNGTVTEMPLKYYRPQIIKAYSHKLKFIQTNQLESVVYGSTCREEDVLYEGNLPVVKRGDYLIFYAVGAYNQSMGSNFIFGKTNCVMLN